MKHGSGWRSTRECIRTANYSWDILAWCFLFDLGLFENIPAAKLFVEHWALSVRSLIRAEERIITVELALNCGHSVACWLLCRARGGLFMTDYCTSNDVPQNKITILEGNKNLMRREKLGFESFKQRAVQRDWSVWKCHCPVPGILRYIKVAAVSLCWAVYPECHCW